ncbi:DUF6869 domain-containing protein [Lysobacter antibioticus]|nr:hypothetical protein [Lysobacter antibioticus]
MNANAMADAWLRRLDKIVEGKLVLTEDVPDETDWVDDRIYSIIIRDRSFDLIVEFVNKVLERRSTEEVMDNLAAGPVETMLFHGREVALDLIVEEARRNRLFKQMLGGVWQNNLSDELWEKFLQARGEM